MTEEVIAKICKLVREGDWIDTAASMAGIHPDTARSWMRQGAKDLAREVDTQHARFARELDAARAHNEHALVHAIAGATREDWKAGAWLLARKNPARFSEKLSTVAVGDEVAETETLTPEQARTRWLDIGRAMGVSDEALAACEAQWGTA